MKRSIFREVDSIRLTQILINELVKGKHLISQGFVDSIINFNNDFEIYGPKSTEQNDEENSKIESEVDLMAKELFK